MPLSISVPVADKIEIMEFRTRQNDDLSSLFSFIVISFVLRQIGSLGLLPRANSPRNNKRPPRHVIPGGVEPPPVEPIRLSPRFHSLPRRVIQPQPTKGSSTESSGPSSLPREAYRVAREFRCDRTRAQILCANDSCTAGEFSAGTLDEGNSRRTPSADLLHSEDSPDNSMIPRQTKLLRCLKMPD